MQVQAVLICFRRWKRGKRSDYGGLTLLCRAGGLSFFALAGLDLANGQKHVELRLDIDKK